MKKLLIAYMFIGLLLIALAAFAHGPEEGYPMGPWMWREHGTGWWIFPLVMFAMMVIFFLLFIILPWRRGRGAPWCGFGEHKEEETALDILKKRYAKGEITKEEFEAIKKDL